MKSISQDNIHCDGCPLDGKATPRQFSPVPGAKIIVITAQPSATPETYGRLMPKNAATMFSRAAQDAGFKQGDFSYCASIRCPFDPDTFTGKQKTLIAKKCRPYLVETIESQKPLAVVTLGAEAASQVVGRKVQITKVRGLFSSVEYAPQAVVLPMLNPILPVLYPQHQTTFFSDFATLARLRDSNFSERRVTERVFGKYKLVDDLQFLVDRKPDIVSIDTEATGLRWYSPDAKLLTIQVCTQPGEAFMVSWDHPDRPLPASKKVKIRAQLKELLGNAYVIGQNAKFDRLWIQAHAAVKYRFHGDTLMLAAQIDENALTKNLGDLVKRYVPEMAGYSDHFDATVDKSNMAAVPLGTDFVNYGCGDADAVMRLHQVLYSLLAEDPKALANYERVSIPTLNAFVGMERRGSYVDEAAADEFQAAMELRCDEMYRSLLAQVPKSIKREHVDKGLSFTRSEFLLDILFYHPDGFCLKPRVYTKTTQKLSEEYRVPSVSTKDHLPYFFEECPFTQELAEYIKAARVLTANVLNFRKKYVQDGKVRPTYRLDKTVTGRSSSEDPNGQNYPNRGPVAKAYRKIFVAPPASRLIQQEAAKRVVRRRPEQPSIGIKLVRRMVRGRLRVYAILSADLSQAELRIAGDMANDPTMREIYRTKGDIHTFTALIVLGVTLAEFKALPKSEQKLARTKAKSVNFGFLYGMGWRNFIVFAKTQYGVEFSDAEAKRIRTQFFKRYSRLPDWHARMRAFAKKHGYVRSYTGRVRHLPMINSSDELIAAEAERQAINSPVQNTASDIGLIAISRIDQEVDEEYLAVAGFIHDAVVAYVPVEYLEWGAKTLKWYMETVPLEEWFGVRMKVPIVADVGFGANMSDMYEMGEVETDADGYHKVGTYDFDALFVDDDGNRTPPPFDIPKQLVPPNNGRLQVYN